jgi:hypothetical protein
MRKSYVKLANHHYKKTLANHHVALVWESLQTRSKTYSNDEPCMNTKKGISHANHEAMRACMTKTTSFEEIRMQSSTPVCHFMCWKWKLHVCAAQQFTIIYMYYLRPRYKDTSIYSKVGTAVPITI